MASNSAELKIDDEYVNTASANIQSRAKALQQYINQYRLIMAEVTGQVITDGETHEALADFCEYAQTLDQVVEEAGDEIKRLCDTFLAKVDEADSYLY